MAFVMLLSWNGSSFEKVKKLMAIMVSAVIPAYNCEKTLGRALDSMLSQTCPPDEIIVVNDGSTDNTVNIIESYVKKHPSIRGVTQENSGPAAARNHGVKLASSEWVAFLDSDDFWLPFHLKNLANVLEANSELSWAAAPYVHEKDALTKKVFSRSVLPNYLAIAHRQERPVNADSVLIRRSVLDECNGFREDWHHEEDLWLWFQIGLKYPKLGHSPVVSSIYTYQPTSLTNRISSCQKELDLMVIHTDEMIKYLSDNGLLEREDVQVFLGGRVGKILYVSLFVSHCEYKKQQNKYRSFLEYVSLPRRARIYVWLSLLRLPVLRLHKIAVYTCRCLHKLKTKRKEVSPCH